MPLRIMSRNPILSRVRAGYPHVMVKTIASYPCNWPERLQAIEAHAHEMVVGPVAEPKQAAYGIILALLSAAFKPELPNAHFVSPRAPLRFTPPERPQYPLAIPSLPSPPVADAPLDLELYLDLSSDVTMKGSDLTLASDSDGDLPEDSLANQHDAAATLGNNSSANRKAARFTPPPSDVSIANFNTPASGLGQSLFEKGADFIVYRVNHYGCLTGVGGPDVLRLVVEFIPGTDQPGSVVELSSKEKLRLHDQFSGIRAMNSVGAGFMLLVKGNAYFWHYDELLGGDEINVSLRLAGRFSRSIDSWEFMRFLQRWAEGEEGVRFDQPQNGPSA